MEKSPVFGIIGGTICGNRGAESMVVTTIGMLRKKFPKSKFLVFSYHPEKDRKLVDDENISIIDATPVSLVLKFFPQSMLIHVLRSLHFQIPFSSYEVKQLIQCNVLLDVSGISFADGREVFLPYNILTILPAMNLNIPVIKMAQALGPFTNPINRLAAKVILPKCNRIFSRGDITSNNLQSINQNNFQRTADIAFLYQSQFSISHENEDKVNRLAGELERIIEQKKKIIVISPSSVVYQKSSKKKIDYLGCLLQLIRALDDENTCFLFLPNSTRQSSSKPRNNDIYVLNLLMHRALISMDPDTFSKTYWVTWDVNTASLRRLMNMANIVVTSRFHSMVSSLALGIPTLVIGWSHKYVETMEDFGMQRFVVDFENKEDNLINLANELIQDEIEIRKQLNEQLPVVQDLSTNQFTYIESLF
jgi:colanic acid/amylovoran biosynthesis protein